MTLTTHLLAGAAIGAKISNPFAAFILGLISHYILDSLPHYEYHIGDWNQAKERLLKRDFKNSGVRFYRITLDALLGMSLIFLFLVLKQEGNSIIFGSLGGFLPDFFWGLYFLLPKIMLKEHGQFHEFFHIFNNSPANKKFPVWGRALLEISVGLLILSALF